jgi:hypothetical protein
MIANGIAIIGLVPTLIATEIRQENGPISAHGGLLLKLPCLTAFLGIKLGKLI